MRLVNAENLIYLPYYDRFIDLDPGTTGDRRPSMQTRLYTPLKAGTTYRFSMYLGVFKTDTSGYGNVYLNFILGNVGVYFSSSKLSDYRNAGRIAVSPQIRFTNFQIPQQDSFVYVELSASYRAQGGEQYMTIANFDSSSQFNVIHFIGKQHTVRPTDTLAFNFQQLIIDDVSLVEDSTKPMISLTDFSLGNDTAICRNTQLSAPPYFLSYLWNTGETTRAINVSTPGTYWCSADYGCSTRSDTIEVSFIPPPAPFHIRDTALCAGLPFIAVAPDSFRQYLWNDGAQSSSREIRVPGRHWIQVTDQCGATYTDTFRLVTTPVIIPGININSTPPIVLCAGTPVTFITNNTGAGSNPRYQWYKNGVEIPGATAVTYLDTSLAQGDTLTIAMFSSAACPATQPTISNHVGVTVHPVLVPGVRITSDPPAFPGPGAPVSFTAVPVNGGGTPEYIWFVNGTPQVGAVGDTWTTNSLRAGDVVTARMESKVACPEPAIVLSNELIMQASTGLAGASGQGVPLQLYPNPARDWLNIRLSKAYRSGVFEVSDNLGRTLIYQSLSGAHELVDMRRLPAGAYIYRLILDAAEYRGKLLKL